MRTRGRSHVREWAALLEERVSDDAVDTEEHSIDREKRQSGSDGRPGG